MRIGIVFSLILAFFTYADADTIVFKDGRKLTVTSSAIEGGNVKCTINRGSISFPKEKIERIEKTVKKQENAIVAHDKERSTSAIDSEQKYDKPDLSEEQFHKIKQESDKVKLLIGRNVWAKKFLRNPDIYDKNNIVSIQKLERVQVADVLENPDSKIECNEFYSSKEKRRVRVCHKSQPLRIHLKKDDNSTMYLNFSTVDSGYQYECLACEYLLFEDPYQKHPDWSKKAWDAIKDGKIFVGMDVQMLLMSWGNPVKINKSIGSWGLDEQWVYSSGDMYRDNYVYLRNGKVRSFQISN